MGRTSPRFQRALCFVLAVTGAAAGHALALDLLSVVSSASGIPELVSGPGSVFSFRLGIALDLAVAPILGLVLARIYRGRSGREPTARGLALLLGAPLAAVPIAWIATSVVVIRDSHQVLWVDDLAFGRWGLAASAVTAAVVASILRRRFPAPASSIPSATAPER